MNAQHEDATMTKVMSYVDGAHVSGDGGTLTRTDPADRDRVVAEVALADAATYVEACRVARAAQPGWQGVPAPVRGTVIRRLGRLIEDNKEALARIMVAEIGKPIVEARGEVQEAIDTCDVFLGEGRRPERPHGAQRDARQAPVHLPPARRGRGGDHRRELPHRRAVLVPGPRTAVRQRRRLEARRVRGAHRRRLHRAVRRRRGPRRRAQPRRGRRAHHRGRPDPALDEGLVDKIGFTGSVEVGRRLGRLAGEHLQTACLELGGKNPLVVMDDADLDLAVEGALFSGFGTAGQRCTSLGTAIVHRSQHAAFLDRLQERLAAATIGDPRREDVLYGPMIDERFAERFLGWFDHIADHHTVSGSSGTGRISADNPRDNFTGDAERGLYMHPTIVDGVRPGDVLYEQETFGPIIGVTAFDDLDEAIELSNGHGYGLSAAIYTRDPSTVFTFRERNSAGMLSVNNSTSGAEAHLPFGGDGKSGNGSRQSGQWVLEQFTRWQSMNWDHSGSFQRAQMDVADLAGDPTFRLADIEDD
jgi:alpha-ketoglutaric semialdehyde dehydrogenase